MNILCEHCGENPATAHIHTNVNGVARNYNLCAKCAMQSGFGTGGFGNFGFGNVLGSLLGESVNTNQSSGTHVTENQSVRCECCGATFDDIAESGRLGCAECYRLFLDSLIPSLQRIHGKTRHGGKVPNCTPAFSKTLGKIEKLKEELKMAVESEAFEKAATLRDQLRDLENTKPQESIADLSDNDESGGEVTGNA